MSSVAYAVDERTTILNRVIEAAAGLTQDFEHAFSDPISPGTRLVADLGCQSLDIVVLTAQLSRQLNQRDLPFERLFLEHGKPVADISVGTLAEFLWEHMQAAGPPAR